MYKRISFILLVLMMTIQSFATHQRAAEISYQCISAATFTYKITLVTYTFTESLADRPEIEIAFGYQNKIDTVARASYSDNNATHIRTNYYYTTHSFPGAGAYLISMTDPNRNAGVINVPNSVEVPMYVESLLIINPFINPLNSSPILNNPPVDEACVGVPFAHNPGAIDIDGDELRYSLVKCKTVNGIEIPGYFMPYCSDTIKIDSHTGDLLWDSPIVEGEYNIAILIEEFRNNVKIGSVLRDMQINVRQCNNRQPQIECAEQVCVFAGDTLKTKVIATDQDSNQTLSLRATSDIINNSLPNFAHFPNINGYSPITATLSWIPDFSFVRNENYFVYFKVEDNGNPNLVNFKTLQIKVLAKSPIWDSIASDFNSITVNWQTISDSNVAGYKIYRSNAHTNASQDSCTNGMTDSHYQLVKTINDASIDTWTDAISLEQTSTYCYRITAVLKNGCESQMSEEICRELKSNKAIITKIDVLQTDNNNGEIEIIWHKPLDLLLNNPDYQYVIRAFYGNVSEILDTIYNIDDTVFLHQNINTKEIQYFYEIEILFQNSISVSKSKKSSSIFLDALPMSRKINLNWQANTAWHNDFYTVFRYNNLTNVFDSIDISFENQYLDENLENDSVYRYKIRSNSSYHIDNLQDTTLMFSNEISCIPLIAIPCKVYLEIGNTVCKPASAEISWTLADDCDAENVVFHVFYAQHHDFAYAEIGSTSNFSFLYDNMDYLIGCFYVVGENEKGVYGENSDSLCLDAEECMNYDLPNIFTPNSDGINDVFKAFDNDFTGVFYIEIFNRWGNVVYSSENPEFQWNGINQSTKQPCPDGTYYYLCSLYYGEHQLSKKVLKGFVTILR